MIPLRRWEVLLVITVLVLAFGLAGALDYADAVRLAR